MNYARILLVQRQEVLEEILQTTLSTFEREVIVDELMYVEAALSELRVEIKLIVQWLLPVSCDN